MLEGLFFLPGRALCRGVSSASSRKKMMFMTLPSINFRTSGAIALLSIFCNLGSFLLFILSSGTRPRALLLTTKLSRVSLPSTFTQDTLANLH
ncbi:unnamed protein product [Allacma fusca]|uniref:Uncharacterized protein n=1 Tax=Allacma fusca TaxID=39272 RepID=A0A8J2PRK2_9HEXA|nr:unnamed protein product [Allacma fusca]